MGMACRSHSQASFARLDQLTLPTPFFVGQIAPLRMHGVCLVDEPMTLSACACVLSHRILISQAAIPN